MITFRGYRWYIYDNVEPIKSRINLWQRVYMTSWILKKKKKKGWERKRFFSYKKDELKVIPLKSQLETKRLKTFSIFFFLTLFPSWIILTKLNCNYTRAKSDERFDKRNYVLCSSSVTSRISIIPGKDGRMMRGKKKHMFRIRSFLPVDLSQGSV